MTPTVSPRRVVGIAYRRLGVKTLLIRAHAARVRRRPVVVNRRGIELHVDRGDPRAAWLSMSRGELDRAAVATWRRLVAELRPTVAIDIGANYGEVAFGAAYPSGCAVHLVEPNPATAAALERTIAGLPPGFGRPALHRAAAAEGGGVARLHLHGQSGRASLVTTGITAVDVPTVRLDAVVPVRPEDRVIFKIDVEGAEASALRGMSGLIRHGATGLCEIVQADGELLDLLYAHWHVALTRGETEVPVAREELARAVRRYGERRGWEFGKDVVLRPPA